MPRFIAFTPCAGQKNNGQPLMLPAGKRTQVRSEHPDVALLSYVLFANKSSAAAQIFAPMKESATRTPSTAAEVMPPA